MLTQTLVISVIVEIQTYSYCVGSLTQHTQSVGTVFGVSTRILSRTRLTPTTIRFRSQQEAIEGQPLTA